MRRILETAAFVAVMVALVLAITSLSPAALPRVTKVLPPQDNKSVCLPATGTGVVLAADAEAVGTLSGEPRPAKGPQVLTGQSDPVVLSGSGRPIGGYVNEADAVRSWTPCSPAVSQGVLVVPSARNTELLIVNSDRSDAAVDLTLQGVGGPIESLGARGIAIASNSSRVIALSVLAADVDGPVSVDFRASRGRATIIARTSTPGGLDTASVSTAATSHLLAGVPAGAGSATVLLSNPAERRVAAKVIALGATANYTPEGGGSISIPPRSTIAVPLGASLAGEATALRVTADTDIAAALVTGATALEPAGALLTEQAFVEPVFPATQLAAFAPSGGVLQVSAVDEQATVLVTAEEDGVSTQTTLVVPAGGTVMLPLTASAPHLVTVASDVEVFGAVVLVDTAGAAVLPLVDSGVVTPDPLAAELDPTLN